MESLIKIGQLILSLSILVILHEMGHFLPAKWFKTKVEKFYLFFDFLPFGSLFKKQIGETEYGIGWLPLGGYVKIAGMVDESMDTEALKQPPQPWEFRSKKAWQRLIIMLGGVTVNFILGIFLFGMILWNYGREYLPNTELKNGVAVDSILIRNGFRNGDVVVKVGDATFDRLDPGGFVKEVALRNASSATVLRNGEMVNLPLPADFAGQITGMRKKSLMVPRMTFTIDSVPPPPKPSFWSRISGKKETPPPPAILVKKGDRVISVNGKPTVWYEEYQHEANQNKSQEVDLGVVRGGDTISLKGKLDENAKLGVYTALPLKTYTFSTQNFSLAQAVPEGYRDAIDFLKDQLSAFGQMFKGKIKVQDNLGSLISIGSMFSPTWDWESFWHLTASLSLILAFMNLLPIPALDGGYVVFLIWEVVTGKRVSDSFMEKAVTVGFFLLLGLMVFAFGLDIWRNFIR